MPTLDHAFARIRLVVVFLLVFSLLLFAGVAPALAQFDSAAVVGTVRDSSSAVVPGAKVTLTSAETGISVSKTTGDDGNFEFAAVKPGMYVVTAEKTGFALALVDNLRAQVGARLRVDLVMPVGQMTFNHTNFRAPNGNRSSGAFGTITATQDPRQLQFGFKLLW